MQGVCSDKRHCFITILDDVLTVGESAGGEEQAGQTHPHPVGLLEGVGEGYKKAHEADFAETLQWLFQHCKKCV
jgi:hypothetical protein